MLISELLEDHPCKTPGAMFNSKIKGDSVSIKVKLPKEVKIGKISDEEGEKYDDMLHNAMEKIVAKIVKDTVPNSKEKWDDARKHDINESVDDIKSLIDEYFVIYGDENIRINRGLVSITGDVRLKNIGLTPAISELPVKFKSVKGHFEINTGGLKTLEGCPEIVYGDFSCWNNNLQNLIGGPKTVHGDYKCARNPLTSLEGLPVNVINGRINLPYSKDVGLLKLLFVNQLQDIILVDHNVRSQGPKGDLNHLAVIENILKKYLRQGRKGALACAAELTKAGFKGNAKL